MEVIVLSSQSVADAFFEQPTLLLARSLLGKLLVKETELGIAAGWIVETEAYIGPGDRAAHSFGNRRTPRTEVMFGPPGYVYTYVMHTHCLVNIVSGEPGHPEAVLIRAVEPCIGVDLMYDRRGTDKKLKELTNGPGKLTKALGIVKEDYGRPFFERPLYIAEGRTVESIAAGPRIGIDNSGEAREYPWRFWVEGNPFVSK
ncbi:DNA-3-methyladenine glycosylase [Paenibacillus alginolyticus]|uniref:Putative 3-methyladenine DNA glycosylase n=1 Tax=Paenibacillus alginolyticus TaxID=59839 RepID=A0ABT4GCT0_9BACL|nr:DNA-3-methyladenine glycosylase [Paenibacillus alginolyticus]MCY9669145.1 DNA-3-methyladenine glycosylase [Paenibacillus alginolyticus]MCY9693939.1 DNA-3-methyladenine glycosylase [Paenibacillus alginolyticus]MEC0146860.1 DNA-3-methyladenine glycosylase [Paenibacillus alginolyticus]